MTIRQWIKGRFYFKPFSHILFMTWFRSKKHTCIYIYIRNCGIYFGNNWSGQLNNPIYGGFNWCRFRWFYYNSLTWKK